MSAVIGSLRANLGLDTTQFDAGLDRAKTKMNSWGSRMKTIGTAAAASFVALAGGLSVAVKANIDMADQIGKLSQAAGVSTEELSTLKFAADLAGVSLDGLGNSLKKLGRSMSDALRTPTSEQALAFKALGVSITDAQGRMRNQVDVMNDIADQFSKVKDGANKTALAIALFGRSGAELIPLLNAGAAGINEMREEARQLGLELDKGTTVRAEQFNDTLTRIGAIFNGLVTQITAQLLPTLNKIAGVFHKLATNSFNVEYAVKGLDIAMKVTATGAAAMASALRLAAINMTTLFDVSGRLIQLDVSGAWAALSKGASDLVTNVKSTIDDYISIWSDAEQKISQQPLNAGTVFGDAPALANAQKALTRQKELADEAAKAFDEMKRAGEQVFEATRTPAERLKMEVQRLNDLLRAGVIDWDTYGRAVRQAQDALADAGERQRTWGEFFEEHVSSAFDKIIDGSFRLRDAIRDMAKDILKTMAQSSIRSLFTSLAGGGGSGSGGFLQSFLSSSMTSLFGGFRAMGGDVQPGKGYVVGERGPEWFEPRASGSIVPNGAMAGSRATYAPTTIVNISGSATERDRAFMMQALDERDRNLRRNLGAMVNDSSNRGGIA